MRQLTPIEPEHRRFVREPAVYTGESAASDEGFQPGYGALLRRYYLVLLAFIVLGVGIGVVLLVTDTPVYRVQLLLELNAINESYLKANADPLSANYDPTSVNLQTQIHLLQSGQVTRRVGDQLLREAPPRLIVSGLFPELRARARKSSTDPLAIQRSAVDMAELTFDARPINGTRLIELSCEATHPEIAARFLNSVAREFIDGSERGRSEGTEKATRWLDQQIEETKIKLRDSEDRLREFVRQSGNLFAAAESTIDDVKVKQLQQELAAAQADRIGKQSRYEPVLKGQLETIPELVNDAYFQGLQTKLNDVRRQRSVLSATLTPKHYKMRELDQQEQELENSIKQHTDSVVAGIKTDYDRATRRERLLSSAYAGETGIVTSQAAKAGQYVSMKREVETLRASYDSLLQRLNQLTISGSLPVGLMRLVEPCQPPPIPYSPKAATTLMLSVLGGLGFAVAFVFARERLNTSIKTPGTTRGIANVPELGVIPSAQKLLLDKRKLVLPRGPKRLLPEPASLVPLCIPHDDQSRVTFVVKQRGSAALAESFRTTLTSLEREAGAERKVIMVTSPNAADGKTTVVTNLGIAMAQTGKKVLLVDADFRRPQLGRAFDVDGPCELTSLILADTPIAEYKESDLANKTSVSNLWVLPNHGVGLSIEQLIHSSRLSQIIERLRSEFDIVLIDVPPLLNLADARIIGRHVDGAALIVRAGQTEKWELIGACQCLQDDGIPVFGTVENNWNPEGMSDRYYYH